MGLMFPSNRERPISNTPHGQTPGKRLAGHEHPDAGRSFHAFVVITQPHWSLYCPGVMPRYFLKVRIKALLLQKPTSSAVLEML